MRATDRHIAQMAARNLWGNVNMHKPEGVTPPELIKRVRFHCLRNGGDIGYVVDIKAAMIEIGWEDPELQRSYFHPDYLSRTAGSWAYNWRTASDKFKKKLLAEFDSIQVEYEQFEPLQPEQHD
jgi:hypothetical protein